MPSGGAAAEAPGTGRALAGPPGVRSANQYDHISPAMPENVESFLVLAMAAVV